MTAEQGVRVLYVYEFEQPPLVTVYVGDEYPRQEPDLSAVPVSFQGQAQAVVDGFDASVCASCGGSVGWVLAGAADERTEWCATWLVRDVEGRGAALCEDCAPFDPAEGESHLHPLAFRASI